MYLFFLVFLKFVFFIICQYYLIFTKICLQFKFVNLVYQLYHFFQYHKIKSQIYLNLLLYDRSLSFGRFTGFVVSSFCKCNV
jgi:hypothetical protein